MTLLSKIKTFSDWNKALNDDFLTIAGPCSAESEEQVLETAQKIAKYTDVKVFRSGVWKPRTRPESFEGVGEKAFPWLKKVKEQYGFLITTEVATPQHVEKALENKIDILWIGARTTSNPFSVTEIAEALKGVDIPVMVKNPINPDMTLWLGALERFNKVGINKLAAIHRGFYPFEQTKLRNIPKWELAIELKSLHPTLPIIGDPSHMAGYTRFIKELAQQSLDLNYNGLMFEAHYMPSEAKSDAKQQLTPLQLKNLLQSLVYKTTDAVDNHSNSTIETYRNQIDSIDYQLLELLSQRMDIVRKIGEFKRQNKITVFQLRRWIEILQSREEFSDKIDLSKPFVRQILRLIHKESIKEQTNQK